VCVVTPAAQITLPMSSLAPRRAREFFRSTHCPAHQARAVDEAQLLITELVTNAVLHGGPPVTLGLACDGGRGLQVRVSDGSPLSPPTPGEEVDLDSESGRGIALVDVLTDDWGVEPTAEGKAVWFRLTA